MKTWVSREADAKEKFVSKIVKVLMQTCNFSLLSGREVNGLELDCSMQNVSFSKKAFLKPCV